MDTLFQCTVFGTKNTSGKCRCIDEKIKWENDECECKTGSDRSFCKVEACSMADIKLCGRPAQGVCKIERGNLLFSSQAATPICNEPNESVIKSNAATMSKHNWFNSPTNTLAPQYLDWFRNIHWNSKLSEKGRSKCKFKLYDIFKPPPTAFPTYSFGNTDAKLLPKWTQNDRGKISTLEPKVFSDLKDNYDTYKNVSSDSSTKFNGFYLTIVIVLLIVKFLAISCVIYDRSKKRERQQGNACMASCNTSASLRDPPMVRVTDRFPFSNHQPPIPLPYASLRPIVRNPISTAIPMPYYSLNTTIENNSLAQTEYIIAMPLNDFGQQSILYVPVPEDRGQSLVLDLGDPCDPLLQYGDVPQTPPPTYEESTVNKHFECANF